MSEKKQVTTTSTPSLFEKQNLWLMLLGVAGCNFIMGIPGADDVMLNYQSTSFHDILFVRKALNLKPSPEFEQWLKKQNITDDNGNMLPSTLLQQQLLEKFI